MNVKLYTNQSKGHQTITFGKWQVNYLGFKKGHLKGRAPIIILGGAFQKFESFKKDVEILVESHPVILLDLPGQGGNDQLAADLDFEGYADLLKEFVDHFKLSKIIPISLSYGSAIGYFFAYKYPGKVKKLIVGGTTDKLRPSVRMLLQESINSLGRGELKDFSEGVALNLLNYSKRDEIKGASFISKSIAKSLSNLSENEAERYIQNTKRLMNLDGLPGEIHCPTLVIVGEFDNFTTPYECFRVSRLCSDIRFAIVTQADHLAPYEKKIKVNQAYLEFIETGEVHTDEDIILYENDVYPNELRQMEPRWLITERGYISNGDLNQIVNLVDINTYGCKLVLSEGLSMKELLNAKLRLPLKKLEVELIPFHESDGYVSCIFKRCNFKQIHELESYINHLAKYSEALTAA